MANHYRDVAVAPGLRAGRRSRPARTRLSVSAEGLPRGARPLGGAAQSAGRGDHNSAEGPPQGARPLGGAARSAVRGDHTLLIFAKEPVPGQVKTRLAVALGAARAAQIYRELTSLTLAHAVAARGAGVIGAIELWCAPSSASSYFRGIAAANGVSLHTQAEGDLGARMTHAIAGGLARAEAVLLVGTDCPVLDPGWLAQATVLLASHDAVLGPAEDGGYVLVGARRPLPFAGVRWSSPHALADTTAGFGRAGIRWAALPVLWDVDEPADLTRWEALQQTLPATTR
ncbi:MAG: TIGR04282 family arsenosugar biosynthesis glycosyltransferase [Casimicrobiaceae bacterium]